ncbi:MAG: tRNA dihydrouridine(20/20a) synthase DusA [Parvibaculaceae bacterium]
MNYKGKIFAVAPMMDWSDRHCRFFHRQMTRRALLYTEMVTAQAIRHGDRERLIGFDPGEQPVALQIGGSDPKLLAEAARWGEDFGYCEINLNVGCPSDRVQEGRFGACLMAEPDLVAEGVAAMRSAVAVPVTVKCRIGIDDQDEDEDLDRFIGTVAQTGCTTFIIHARKAWLEGLSPKENREIPPLNYERVYRAKRAHPELTVVINGGIASLAEAEAHLAHVDGVMLGRAAYHTPWILADVDRRIFGEAPQALTRADIVARMKPYVAAELGKAPGLARITRHMLGLFHGEPGGRAWRRMISENAHRPGAGPDLLDAALAAVAAQATRLHSAE